MKYRVWVTFEGKTRMELETSNKRLANQLASNFRLNGIDAEVSWVRELVAA